MGVDGGWVGHLFCGIVLNEFSSSAERAGCFTLIVFLLSCGCQCFVSLPRCAIGWCVVCICCISWSYVLDSFSSSLFDFHCHCRFFLFLIYILASNENAYQVILTILRKHSYFIYFIHIHFLLSPNNLTIIM